MCCLKASRRGWVVGLGIRWDGGRSRLMSFSSAAARSSARTCNDCRSSFVRDGWVSELMCVRREDSKAE